MRKFDNFISNLNVLEKAENEDLNNEFVISGIIKLKYAIEIKDNKAKAPIYSMIVSILMILCGILFIVNPFEGAIAITQIIGIFLIVYACLDIINYCCIRKDLKEIKRIFRS